MTYLGCLGALCDLLARYLRAFHHSPHDRLGGGSQLGPRLRLLEVGDALPRPGASQKGRINEGEVRKAEGETGERESTEGDAGSSHGNSTKGSSQMEKGPTRYTWKHMLEVKSYSSAWCIMQWKEDGLLSRENGFTWTRWRPRCPWPR